MLRAIHKNNLAKLIKFLSTKTAVFAPFKKEGEIVFDSVSGRESDKSFDFRNGSSLLPPKFLFLPPEEEIFSLTKNKFKPLTRIKPFVLFCSYPDLFGILELDEVMQKEPTDFFYSRRREAATLVAVSEWKAESAIGGDLILEKIHPNYYRTIVLTAKGKKISQTKFFENKNLEPKAPCAERSALRQLLLDSELLKETIVWSRHHPIWEELAKTCLGCGICTYVCPLCYCFSMEDKKSFDGSKCSRCRKWDACTLPDFATVAGAKNFRPTLKERYYNWYYHKFVRGYKEFGRPHCVACGRCQKYCPAGIDIFKVLSRIVEDYKKSRE